MLRMGFNDYFGITPKYEMINTHKVQEYDDSNYISNSVFERITYSSALSFSSSSSYLYLYIEKCGFFNCKNGKDG